MMGTGALLEEKLITQYIFLHETNSSGGFPLLIVWQCWVLCLSGMHASVSLLLQDFPSRVQELSEELRVTGKLVRIICAYFIGNCF